MNFVVEKNHTFSFFIIYSRLFWKEEKEKKNEMCIFDALFYTENENCKDQHIIHVFVLLGKFHIRTIWLNVNQFLPIL